MCVHLFQVSRKVMAAFHFAPALPFYEQRHLMASGKVLMQGTMGGVKGAGGKYS